MKAFAEIVSEVRAQLGIFQPSIKITYSLVDGQVLMEIHHSHAVYPIQLYADDLHKLIEDLKEHLADAEQLAKDYAKESAND